MKKLLLILPILLIFAGCQAGPVMDKIQDLQSRVDSIAKKVETEKGLKAKETTEGMTEEQVKKLDDISKKIDALNTKINELTKKVDDLKSDYESHLKKYHR